MNDKYCSESGKGCICDDDQNLTEANEIRGSMYLHNEMGNMVSIILYYLFLEFVQNIKCVTSEMCTMHFWLHPIIFLGKIKAT